MKRYRYKARNAEGVSIFGEVDAESVDEAVAQLAAEGLTADPNDVHDSSPAGAARSDRPKGRLSEEQAAELAQRIAELAEAGLPLAPGLRAIAQELGRGRVSQLLVEIAERLEGGDSLEDTLGADNRHFPAHLRGLIVAGVETAQLPDALQQYVALQRDRTALKRRIWLSVGYPLLLLTCVLLLYLFFSVYIVPPFATMFSDFGTELPRLTKLLIAVCRPNARFLVCLPAFMLYVILLLSTTQLPIWGRRVLYAVPFFGPLWQLSGMVSLARLLGLFVDQKVPLPDALRYTAQGLREPDLAVACLGAARQVRDGRTLGEALSGYWQILPTLRSFADWGQQGGCLGDSLRTAADVFERRLNVEARIFDAVLPSVLFLVVLAFVLFMIVALMLPLISLISVLGF